jgi:hypothetical protein
MRFVAASPQIARNKNGAHRCTIRRCESHSHERRCSFFAVSGAAAVIGGPPQLLSCCRFTTQVLCQKYFSFSLQPVVAAFGKTPVSMRRAGAPILCVVARRAPL